MSAKNPPRPSWITLRPRGAKFSYRIDRRVPLIALIIATFTIVVLVFSINYGQYNMTVGDVVLTLLGLNKDHPDYRNFALVVHTFRLPRILLSFLVGMALATSGTIMQGITRNPLADPYLLGVSSGAGLAAVVLIVAVKTISLYWLPWAALGGALLTAAGIYTFAWKNGTSSPIRLILIGIAIEAVLAAVTSTILLFGQINDVQQAYVWLAGSVYGRNWEHVYAIGGWLLIFLPAAMLMARQLNTLGLGEDTAKGLGQRVEWQRGVLLFISVTLAAVAVSVSGTIGFIGLIAPHITRRLVGPSHEGLIPASALFGGALLVLADLVGRWVIAPSELPIGVVTAMIGAPYFMYLLYRNRNA
ncbi:MAG: iron ABC transporter permease [Chloroflexi bacterium]|nr:iron ABC transporter permease [Chloroflexota bacterium]MCC6891815.1 iron ABC transporter permease [Anaerolineae bacterium]